MEGDVVDMLKSDLVTYVPDNILVEYTKQHGISVSNLWNKWCIVEAIINDANWSEVLATFGEYGHIQDCYRVCSVCGSLMDEGYCVDAGWRYYCSDDCLHTDYTDEQWSKECDENDQSYWTQWWDC